MTARALAACLAACALSGVAPCQPPRPARKASKPAVVEMLSPNKNSRGKARIATIVIHHTAGRGSARAVARYFQKPSSKTSAHYIVGKDGTIVQSVKDADRAWHAGRPEFMGKKDVNSFSVGIELVNRGDGKDPYTDKQYRALGRLLAYLLDEYGVSRDRVVGHRDVALPKGRKVDPSDNFNYARMFQEAERARRDAPPRPK